VAYPRRGLEFFYRIENIFARYEIGIYRYYDIAATKAGYLRNCGMTCEKRDEDNRNKESGPHRAERSHMYVKCLVHFNPLPILLVFA
jgi:hypothetical protein